MQTGCPVYQVARFFARAPRLTYALPMGMEKSPDVM
jgi:hypothetical protein